MISERIKAVYFDIDNTLYNFDRAHEAAMEELLGYGKKEFLLDPISMKQLLAEAQKSVIERLGMDNAAIHNRLIRFQRFLELLKYSDYRKAMEMNQIYWGTVLKVMMPEPGIMELLNALKGAGVSLGIGSDMNSDVQYQKLERLGILQYFSMIVTSEEAGKEKPHPEFFKLCADKAQCKPEECIFIGDNRTKDVTGADLCGLHGVWYHPKPFADGEYGSLDEKEKNSVIHTYLECLTADGIRLGDWIIKTEQF